jgi:uncharacterized damage-inducible protein DinB
VDDKKLLLNQFRYKQWSDARLLLTIKPLEASIENASQQFIFQQLNHIVIVEELFKARLLEYPAPHKNTNTAILPNLNELEGRLERNNKWYFNFAKRCSNEDLKRVIKFYFVDDLKGAMEIREILFHIINHATYHRGAIGSTIDRIGGKHPADTYSVYLHQAEKQRREY